MVLSYFDVFGVADLLGRLCFSNQATLGGHFGPEKKITAPPAPRNTLPAPVCTTPPLLGNPPPFYFQIEKYHRPFSPRTPPPFSSPPTPPSNPVPQLPQSTRLEIPDNMPPICIAVPSWLLSLEKANPAVHLPFVRQCTSDLYSSTPPICTEVPLRKY